jgi:hypothetical protein
VAIAFKAVNTLLISWPHWTVSTWWSPLFSVWSCLHLSSREPGLKLSPSMLGGPCVRWLLRPMRVPGVTNHKTQQRGDVTG